MNKLVLFVNTELGEFPTTEFTEFNFTGFGLHGRNVVAFSQDGIVELGGDTDLLAGIEGMVEFPSSDFGSMQQKRARAIFIAGRTTEDLTVSMSADNGTWKSYLVKTYGNWKKGLFKKTINREQKGGSLGFKIENIDGGDFHLDNVTVTILELHNKPSEIGL